MRDLKPPGGPGLTRLLQFPELTSGALAWLRGVCLSCHLSSELRPGNTCTLASSWTPRSFIQQYFVSLQL